jgi:hypothetical protein
MEPESNGEPPFNIGDKVRLINPDEYFNEFPHIKKEARKVSLLTEGVTIKKIYYSKGSERWRFDPAEYGFNGGFSCMFYQLTDPTIENLFNALDDKIRRMENDRQ